VAQIKRVSIPLARGMRGFTLVELVVGISIAMIISAVAIPSLLKSFQVYQLNDGANQLGGILKFTRFEAIRRNSTVNCLNTQATASGPANFWADNNGDGVEQPTETQILLGTKATLVPAGAVPGAAALATQVGVDVLTPVSPSNGSIGFDQRGAVQPPAVYVYYVGNSGNPGAGFRAVVLLPSGSVQIWTYSPTAANSWQQVS
jgi:Tfp pilus assembly protein FimT